MKRKSDFISRTVGGQDLVVPIGAQLIDMNAIIVLNPTGKYLWDLLSEDRTVESLAAAVAEQFDVEFHRVLADVQAFLDEIDQMGLLET